MPVVGFVYNRKKTATRNKGAVIEIRVSYDYKKKYLSTGIKVLPKEWRGDMVTGRTDAIELNKALTTMRNKILKAINGMLKEGCLNIQEIPSRMKRLDDAGKTFCEYCQDRAEVRQYGRMDDTCKRYARFLKWFCAGAAWPMLVLPLHSCGLLNGAYLVSRKRTLFSAKRTLPR